MKSLILLAASAQLAHATPRLELGDCTDPDVRFVSERTSIGDIYTRPRPTREDTMRITIVAARPRPAYDVYALPRPPADYVRPPERKLRPLDGDLVTCFAATDAGVAVIDLAYDDAGHVTQTTVHGIANEVTRACITEVARRVEQYARTFDRCPLAFGTTDAATTLGVDIDGETLAWNHQPVASLDALRAAMRMSSDEVVTIAGPIVIRVMPGTPPALVDRVLAIAREVGRDDILIVSRGAGGWEFPAPIELPALPHPRR